jgi:hypothetical protein
VIVALALTLLLGSPPLPPDVKPWPIGVGAGLRAPPAPPPPGPGAAGAGPPPHGPAGPA